MKSTISLVEDPSVERSGCPDTCLRTTREPAAIQLGTRTLRPNRATPAGPSILQGPAIGAYSQPAQTDKLIETRHEAGLQKLNGDPMVSALFDKVVSGGTSHKGSPSEHNAWREVGWIFRDGEIIAIERQGHETRVRIGLISRGNGFE